MNYVHTGNMTLHHTPFATWVRNALEVAYDHVRHTLQRTAARRKRLYDVKAVNRKFPVGSWVLRYYPPAAQKKLGSPLVGPKQVVQQATGHTVGIQKGPDTSIIFIHVDDLKICPAPANAGWTPGPLTAKSLCASTVAFRPGSISVIRDSTPSVIVSTCNGASHTSTRSNSRCNLDHPIDLTDHILSPYQGCRFHSIAHLMCFRYAVLHRLRLFATSVRKWTRHLTDFPTSRFQTPDWQVECRTMLTEIYSHLCLCDMAVKTAFIDTGPRPFCFQYFSPLFPTFCYFFQLFNTFPNFLPLLATFPNFFPTVSHFSPLFTTFPPLFPIFPHFFQLFGIFPHFCCHFSQLLATFPTFPHFSPLFPTCHHFSTLFNTFQHFSTLFNTFQHFSTLFNTFQHFFPTFHFSQLLVTFPNFSPLFPTFPHFSLLFPTFLTFPNF